MIQMIRAQQLPVALLPITYIRRQCTVFGIAFSGSASIIHWTAKHRSEHLPHSKHEIPQGESPMQELSRSRDAAMNKK